MQVESCCTFVATLLRARSSAMVAVLALVAREHRSNLMYMYGWEMPAS